MSWNWFSYPEILKLRRISFIIWKNSRSLASCSLSIDESETLLSFSNGSLSSIRPPRLYTLSIRLRSFAMNSSTSALSYFGKFLTKSSKENTPSLSLSRMPNKIFSSKVWSSGINFQSFNSLPIYDNCTYSIVFSMETLKPIYFLIYSSPCLESSAGSSSSPCDVMLESS